MPNAKAGSGPPPGRNASPHGDKWGASRPVGRVLCTRAEARAGGHPSGTAVAGSLVRSTREHRAGRPQPLAQAPRPGRRAALVTLLRVGFTKPPGSLRALVVSYTTVSPLPRPGRNPDRGGLFSVALSRGSPRVGVTDHPALWSPDLPHRAMHARPGATARPTRPPPRIGVPGTKVRRCPTMGRVHHRPAGPESRRARVPFGAPLADGRPDPASMASLARRSACLLRSRGTQV